MPAELCFAACLVATFFAAPVPAAASPDATCDAQLARAKPTPFPRLKRALARGTAVQVIDFGPPLALPGDDPAGAFAAVVQFQLRKALLHAGINVETRGVAGETATAALARIEAATFGQPPDFAIWRVGDGDAARATPVATFASAVRLGMDMLRSAGVDMAIVGPATPAGGAADAAASARAAALAAVAREAGASYIDRAGGTSTGDTGMGLRLRTTAFDTPAEDTSTACLADQIVRTIVDGVRAQR